MPWLLPAPSCWVPARRRKTTRVSRRRCHPRRRRPQTPTLEMILRMNGATMVKEGAIYKIVPQAAAVRGNVTPQLGTTNRALPPGFSVQIVPLRFVGVREMLRLLEPFAKDAQAVRVD